MDRPRDGGVRAAVAGSRAERAHAIDQLVPPQRRRGADPLGDQEDGRRESVVAQHGKGVLVHAAVAVVERERHHARGGGGDRFVEAHHREMATQELHLPPEQLDRQGERRLATPRDVVPGPCTLCQYTIRGRCRLASRSHRASGAGVVQYPGGRRRQWRPLPFAIASITPVTVRAKRSKEKRVVISWRDAAPMRARSAGSSARSRSRIASSVARLVHAAGTR